MAHYFNHEGYFVIQMFGYRLTIIDRKRNPITNYGSFPAYHPKEYKIGKFHVCLSRV